MNTSSLSLLRFIAVMIVVLYHQRSKSIFLHSAPNILTSGPQVVAFFFVLSGFVLVLAYYDKNAFSLGDYYVKRIARILPVYLLALSLSVSLDIAEEQFRPVALALNIFLLQSWIPTYPLSINGPAWFLSDLLFFYICFPLLVILLRKYAPDPKRVLFSGIVFWLSTQVVLTVLLNTSFYKGYPSPSHDYIYYFPPSHLCSFTLGVCGAYFLVHKKDKLPMTSLNSVSMMIILSALFVVLMEFEPLYDEMMLLRLPFGASVYAPFFLLLILAFCVSSKRIAGTLSWKPFVYLGEISFGVYIMQAPIDRLVWLHVRKHMYGISEDGFMIIYLFILITVGIILFHVVERPIRKYANKRSAGFGDAVA